MLRDFDQESDSSLRESLEQTGGKIGENFETLSKRETDLQHKIDRIKLEIAGYERREGQLAAYAQKILEKKRDLDGQKEAHALEMKQKEADLKSEMSKLSSKIDTLAQRSKEIQSESELNEKSRADLTKRIDELSAVEENVHAEKSHLSSRISFFQSQIDMEMISERTHSVREMQHSLRELESKTQFAERSIEQVEDGEILLRGDIRSYEMNLKRVLSQKETMTHVYTIEVEGLKGKITRTKQDFDVELENQKQREITIAHLRESIESKKSNLKSTKAALKRINSLVNNRKEESTTKEVDLSSLTEEIKRTQEAVFVMKNSQNAAELAKLSAIKRVKEQRIEAQRKAGEEIFLRKQNNRAIREGNRKLQKLIKKLKMADELSGLIDKGYELLNRKAEPQEDPTRVEELIASLNKLNEHLAVAITYNEALQNHKYQEIRACVPQQESEATIELKSQLKAVKKENKKLRRMISRITQPPVTRYKCIARRPLFSHATGREVGEERVAEIQPTEGNFELEKRVKEMRNRLGIRKMEIERRRHGLVSAADVFLESRDMDIECTKFCDCYSHRVGSVVLSPNDWITMTGEVRKQIEMWKMSIYPPETVLKIWNNRMEHLFKKFLFRPQVYAR